MTKVSDRSERSTGHAPGYCAWCCGHRETLPLGMCDLHKAAPDLLAALHGLREWIREPWGPDDGAANEQVIAAADAALAKARGLGVPHDRD